MALLWDWQPTIKFIESKKMIHMVFTHPFTRRMFSVFPKSIDLGNHNHLAATFLRTGPVFKLCCLLENNWSIENEVNSES
jgi:hypothetical protein